MKKLFSYTFIFIFVINIAAHAFIERRYEWWKIRVINLEKEKSKLSIESQTKDINKLINNEINDSHKIIGFFEKYSSGLNNLTEKPAKVANSDLRKIVKKHVEPVFAVYILDQSVNNQDLKYWKNKANETAQNIIFKNFKINKISIKGSFLESLYKSYFTSIEQKYLRQEFLLGSLIEQYDDLLNKSINNIYTSITKEYNFYKTPVTDSKLYNIITVKAKLYFDEINYKKIVKIKESALSKSWIFNQKLESIKEKISNYKKIKYFLKYTRIHKNAENLDYYLKNTDLLEKKAFNSYYKLYCNKQKFISNSSNDPDNINLNIPKEPDIIELFSSIDKNREDIMTDISGTENTSVFNSFSRKLNRLIEKYLSKPKYSFKIEEDKLKKHLLAVQTEKENPEEKLYTDEVKTDYAYFFTSKNLLYKKSHLLHEYKKRNLEYIQWYSNLKKINKTIIKKSIKLSIERNKDYMNFIALLESLAANSYKVSYKNLKAKYIALTRPERHFAKSLKVSLSLLDPAMQLLTKEKIKASKNKVKSLKLNINNTLNSIAGIRKKYFQNMKIEENKERQNLLQVREKIAQFEIELLNKSINQYFNTYQKLYYANQVFEDYAVIYNKVSKDAREGIYSDKFFTAINNNSIFTLLKTFKEKKLIKEFKTKSYLKKQIMTNLSRLKTLTDFYKRHKIEVTNRSEFLKLKKNIYNSFKKNPQIKVSSWRMNEKNYQAVDKKIIALLKKIRKRYLLQTNAKPDHVKENPHRLISLPKINLTIQIPGGWEKRNPLNFEKDKGIKAKFVNKDNNTFFQISLVPLKNKTIDEAAENWIKRSGIKFIKVGWGKKGNKDYYWNLAHHKRKKIIKSYAIKRNNIIIIISGESSKKYFPYFQNRLDTLFASIKL